MTDKEIDKWVEEHIVVPPDNEISEWKRPIYADIVPAIIEWGKVIAHKFYNLGRTLTVEDIKTILDIAFWNDNPQKILEEYNRIKYGD